MAENHMPIQNEAANEQDYNDICKYIETNPLRWAMKRNGG